MGILKIFRKEQPENLNTSGYEEFLKVYPEFSETAFLDDLRNKEYKRLDKKQHVYLDYTGGNLYSESLLREHLEYLKENLFGNPHSTNPSSLLATKKAEDARSYVLKFFNAEDDYMCIFTLNSSGALKIVGECYPFNSTSHFLLSYDNHNSVNGIREFAKNQGASFSYIPINYEDLRINEQALYSSLDSYSEKSNKLFAFPAQSNVSGVKHPLKYIDEARSKGWDVLLDAAAFVPSSRLDLKKVQPDFVCVSFYKIFGYPTGIGALLVRKEMFSKLKKPWFAGGTVKLASVLVDKHYLTHNHERFEDGTINYLGLPAVENGLRFIESVGIENINKRVSVLTDFTLKKMQELKHSNGRNLIQVFGPQDNYSRGGTIIFNYFDVNGKKYPFDYIQELSNSENISLRTGCFCNPGIDEVNTCLNTEELKNYFDSREIIDYNEMYDFLGKLRGAVRISMGIVSNYSDIEYFLSFSRKFLDKELN